MSSTYGDIREGDTVIIQGHAMIASNVQRDRYEPSRVEFIGHVANPHDDIRGTAYDGGSYGCYEWMPVKILRPEEDAANY